MERNNTILDMKGFTLVEMLVVIGLLGLISGVVFFSYRGGENQVVLENAASKIAQDMRLTRSLALEAEAFTCQSPGVFTSYGIYFSTTTPTSYILFAECSGDDWYTAGSDDVIQTISIEDEITIQSTSPSSGLSIEFQPPNPDMSIRGGTGSSETQGQVVVTLDGQTRTITISTGGVIEID